MKKLRLPIFLISILFLFGFLLPKISPVSAQVILKETCGESLTDERNPRPAACYICNQNDLLTNSCATSIKITTGKDYGPLKEGPDFKVEWGDNNIIDINPINPDPNDQNLKIPFVGMSNKEKESFWQTIWPFDTPNQNAKSFFAFWEVSNASENKYLADYFEGTNEYYRNYGNQTTLTNYQGVLRKLTPYEYQNQLKKQLIARVDNGETNQIHDYKIKYIGRFCWDTPFWIDAGKFIFENLQNLIKDFPPIKGTLAFFSRFFNVNAEEFKIELPDIGHYCLYASLQEGITGWFIVKTNELTMELPIIGPIYNELLKISQKIPGLVHFSLYPTVDEETLSSLVEENQPPEPNIENYAEEFQKWKEKDGGYWYRLWQATPMLSREDTLGKIEPYLNKENEEDQIDITSGETSTSSAVPHLARLYEGSKIISDLLTPVWDGEKTIEMVKTPEIPETNPPNICFKGNYLPPTGEGDDLCCGPVKVKFKAVDEFTDLGYYEAKCDKYSTLTKDEKAICDDTYTQTVSRSIGINLKHPYLDEIWSYTTNANGGFFNIFRPHEYPAFEDIDATQAISYSSSDFGSEEIVPAQGLFFYPHLGGVQKAKEWVVNQALWPLCDKAISPQCPAN